MGGKLAALAFVTLAAVIASPARADETSSKPGILPLKAGANPKKSADAWQKKLDAMTPELRKEVLEKLDQLPPAERERFKQNFDKWQKLDPGERAGLRERDEQRKKAMRKDAEAAIAQLGMSLTPDQREVFILRYVQERKKLESRLRQEMNDKRTQYLPELIARVRDEVTKQGESQAASR